MKKANRKPYTVHIPTSVAGRLSFLKKLHKGKIDIGKEVARVLFPLLTRLEAESRIGKYDWRTSRKCPKCDSYLIVKQGKFGKFYGCYNHPRCKHTENHEQKK
jgi:hypothetical protein